MKNIKFKVIKENAIKVIEKEKKKLLKLGCIILAVITTASGVIIFFKNKTPEINNQPAKIIEYKKDEKDKTEIFLERVEKLETDLYQIHSYVFSEKNVCIDETVGESSKDYITIRGNFRVKYSIDMTKKHIRLDSKNNKVIVEIPQSAIGVDSVELIGDITEIDRYDSMFEKIKDIFANNEEEMKDLAIKRLFDNSREIANNYNSKKLYEMATDSLEEQLDDYGLTLEVKVVENKSISIKNN